jgi:hypothetical protein
MTIGATSTYGLYPNYGNYPNTGKNSIYGLSGDDSENNGKLKGIGNGINTDSDDVKKPGRRSSPEDCQTCKERKYQDGSDENVSFKSASHISPESAATTVRAHEDEHVSNAYSKAAQKNGEVVNASVTIRTSICPECGRTYVSGGTTNSTIKYTNESNPYVKEQKSRDAANLIGANIDYAA